MTKTSLYNTFQTNQKDFNTNAFLLQENNQKYFDFLRVQLRRQINKIQQAYILHKRGSNKLELVRVYWQMFKQSVQFESVDAKRHEQVLAEFHKFVRPHINVGRETLKSEIASDF
jgi:hypothetical protein